VEAVNDNTPHTHQLGTKTLYRSANLGMLLERSAGFLERNEKAPEFLLEISGNSADIVSCIIAETN